MTRAIGLVIFLSIAALLAMSSDPWDMHPPVKHKILLSGTFGELRTNHFHSGIDIKSRKGTVGDPVYAAWEGHISRIAVKSTGYGNALYIDHPNGKTTVYAHLHRFEPELATYIKEQQYLQESYEVNLYPDSSLFSVEKGEQIGLMGNSGRSFGPHLHFEIRDTESEVPLNPLHKGAIISDGTAPQLRELKIDYMDPDHRTFHQKKYQTINLGKRRYKIRGDTILAGAWRVGTQIKAYDLMEGASNLNGIYAMELRVDDEMVFSFSMDSISFDDTRYLNAHIDYLDRIRNKSYYHRGYRLPGNLIQIYREQGESGIIKLYKDKARKVDIRCSDSDGNTSTLLFWIKRAEDMRSPSTPSYNFRWSWDQAEYVSQADAEIHFPEACFYQDPLINYGCAQDDSDEHFSWSHDIDNHDDPIHKYFRVEIDMSSVPDELRDKAIIGRCGDDGQITNCGAQINESGKLETHVRSMGQYAIAIDTTPPTIKPTRFRSSMTGLRSMRFAISDDLKTSESARGLNYRATVDGKWVLFERDAKSDQIFHTFDDRIEKGVHQLRLEVWDDRMNKTVFKRSFTR